MSEDRKAKDKVDALVKAANAEGGKNAMVIAGMLESWADTLVLKESERHELALTLAMASGRIKGEAK